MKTKPKDGGSAFPVITPGFTPEPGMSLRDWFAGMALAGFYAGSGSTNTKLFELHMAIAEAEKITMAEATAKEAYVQADAMLAQRSKES